MGLLFERYMVPKRRITLGGQVLEIRELSGLSVRCIRRTRGRRSAFVTEAWTVLAERSAELRGMRPCCMTNPCASFAEERPMYR